MSPTTDSWLEVRVWSSPRAGDESALSEAHRAAVVQALIDCGSGGVVDDGASLIGYVPHGVDEATLRRRLTAGGELLRVDVTPIVPVDWSERWREGVHAHIIGPLRIAPPWLAATSDPARTVVIDPAMAFGTGEHASTRGVLRLLATVVRPGDFVADLGAGSAVLSIASVKLGAARVAAVEVDGDAIGNAQSNVERNGVADRVWVIEGDAQNVLPLLAPVRVIVANIVSSVITELLPIMRAALDSDGRAILGGLLVAERAAIDAELERGGWRVSATDVEGEWWSTIVAPR